MPDSIVNPVADPALTRDYESLRAELAGVVPADRLITDPLRRLAYGTDASFYRLVPKLVVRVDSEAEVSQVLAACRRHNTPVTFRAAGTSLSGQAITDSLLMVLGDGWHRSVINDDGSVIKVQPGIIGAEVNRRLAPYGRKIGPDPASIESCKIGGIAANNSSGMCCGTHENTYKTMLSLRFMLADGTLVDTGDAASVASFRVSHADLLARLDEMGRRVREDEALANRIRRKFAIKNTTGYSLNALVDYQDPVDILAHLLIGSEGTLGFIAEVTYRTVPELADKASALLLFPDIVEAGRAACLLNGGPVAAVELMDRASLRSAKGQPGLPPEIDSMGDDVASLLVETRAVSPEALRQNIAAIEGLLAGVTLLRPPAFTTDAAEYTKLWKIRKGLIPTIGAMRQTGTSVIIEDVAFRIEDLADACHDMRALFDKHGYPDAILMGHALAGNLHFVFAQDFSTEAEIERHARFMDEMVHIVVEKYDGSLKAEHGTGRNMAPFVELEWGEAATSLMWEIKRLLDPANLLNPGVLLNTNPRLHLENLKPLPPAHAIVDTCMECGFCEKMCPSHGMTLSPRQRITGLREIARLTALGDPATELRDLYDHHAIDTCAACGLCATACPVGIETGQLTKALRGKRHGPRARTVAGLMARHYGTVLAATRGALNLAAFAAQAVGPKKVASLAAYARKLSGDRLPHAGPNLPEGASMAWLKDLPPPTATGEPVVYLAACAGRTFGPAVEDGESDPLPAVTLRVLERAGFRAIVPDNLANLCCGLAFESEGMKEAADAKAAEMEAALKAASDNGRIPIVMDASACTQRMKTYLSNRLPVKDLVEFLAQDALPRLTPTPQAEPVLLHLNCAARKMGIDPQAAAVAKACAATVVVPERVGCCGFAGDKGFVEPELNDHALRFLAPQVPAGCEAGYSSNRTCEIGLADHAGVPYRHLVYLVDRATR
ncbi:FAD-binding and (Fe-S)-binding domain-containing protein [Nitrospirillum amazonense]|uniref:FAD-binding and (Fe-S)-binding domain-containing protein n=1 Tax=Nitrospirillum amazonense TaxID=28077 RepID=UPI002DD42894|nr:FAD-binding and (Fe-S)-binding domain-containing protein [Nitrospirillum amazonense]MEC4594116.1 FAD-binding and (Fe-S)-binding domain-containing protein [Nitrospirillum amazonense]